MAGTYQVDVVTSPMLESKHHPRKLLRRRLQAPVLVADIPVLAKDAPQVAPGEEDSPGTPTSHEGRFFPKMGTIAGDEEPGIAAADPNFPRQPIDPAFLSTKATMLEMPEGFLSTFSKLTQLPQEAIIPLHNPSPFLRISGLQFGDGAAELPAKLQITALPGFLQKGQGPGIAVIDQGVDEEAFLLRAIVPVPNGHQGFIDPIARASMF
jgi:hypothetical protein